VKPVWLALVLAVRAVSAQDDRQYSQDQYGGINELPSPNGASGQWRLEKFGDRWAFVTPAGHAFFMLGVAGVSVTTGNNQMGVSYRTTATAKYGDVGAIWGSSQVKRLRGWGFNTASVNSSPYVWPITRMTAWPGDHYNPERMSFTNPTLRPSYYAMLNSAGYLPEPMKNFTLGINQTYDRAWIPPAGEADYYDPKLYTYLDGMLGEIPDKAAEWQMTSLNDPANPYRSYLIGVYTDETDQTFSFNTGPDFTTYPATGRNHAHGGYRVAVCSPMQTANKSKKALYADTRVYNKYAWRDFLRSRYQEDINRLNSAWGSNYTSWDSTGVAVSGEQLGVGDGGTLNFSKTLAQTAASKFSVQILAGGVPVGGDICGWTSYQECRTTTAAGVIWGPNLSGTIDYATGALTVAFATDYAPASGAALTVNYVANGWGLGRGLLDEDGRNTTWVGTNSVYLNGASAGFKADIDEFLYQMARHYFTTGKAHTLAHFDKVVSGWKPLYFGPGALCYWNTPPNRSVLRAAGETLDVISVVGYPMSQERLDFIYEHAGDKPMINGIYLTANADSALYRYKDNAMALPFANQTERGAGYAQLLNGPAEAGSLIPAAFSGNGVHPYVGSVWWKFLDSLGEKANWGLVTLSDNAYDGVEAVATDAEYSRTVACSSPLAGFLCGGEEQSYGDVITPMAVANALAKQGLCQQIGGCR
jgi:hypothetical protein